MQSPGYPVSVISDNCCSNYSNNDINTYCNNKVIVLEQSVAWGQGYSRCGPPSRKVLLVMHDNKKHENSVLASVLL